MSFLFCFILYAYYIIPLFFCFFPHTSTFQLLDKPCCHRCRPFSSPGSCLQFCIAHRIPLLVDFSSSVANSRSRALRKSICAQQKSPRIYTSRQSGGFELTKLTCTRLDDNLIRLRGDRLTRTRHADISFCFPMFIFDYLFLVLCSQSVNTEKTCISRITNADHTAVLL